MGQTQTHTSGSTTNQSQNQSVTNPTQNGQVTDFRNSLYPQISQLMQKAAQPVYGQAQTAMQLNSLNSLADSSMKQLSSSLASRTGSLNSGAFAGGASGILQNRNSGIGQYLAQAPMLNQQAELNNQLQVGQLANQVAGPALTTNSSSGSSSGSGTTDQTQTQSQSPMSSLLGIAGAALGGGLTGGASLFGQLGGMLPQIFGGGGNSGGQANLSPGQWGQVYGASPTNYGGFSPYGYQP